MLQRSGHSMVVCVDVWSLPVSLVLHASCWPSSYPLFSGARTARALLLTLGSGSTCTFIRGVASARIAVMLGLCMHVCGSGHAWMSVLLHWLSAYPLLP